MLCDKGYWQVINDKKPNFEKGSIKFKLKGKRLIGTWTLIKLKDSNWLLIKEKDEYVNKISINKFTTSIKSGKTINEIANNQVNITNPEKLIFKKDKVSKQDIINYYC